MGKAEQDRAEKIAAAVLAAFGVFVAFYSRQYLKLGMMIMPGAGFLPFCIGVVLALLGAAWYVKVLVARHDTSIIVDIVAESVAEAGAKAAPAVDSARAGLLSRLLPGILLVVLYAWLFEKAGYIVSTVLFMAGWQKLVEKEGWLKSAVVAAASAAFMHVLFARLLKVFLPAGSWWS